MDNPPVPIRPWFRLASQIRVDPPAQRTRSTAVQPPAAPPTVSQPQPQPQPQPTQAAAVTVAPPVQVQVQAPAVTPPVQVQAPAPAPPPAQAVQVTEPPPRAPVQVTEPPPRVAVAVPAQPSPRRPVTAQVTEPPPTPGPVPRTSPAPVKAPLPTPPPSSILVPASPVSKPSPLPSKPLSPIKNATSPIQSKPSKPTSPKPVNYSTLKSPKKTSPSPAPAPAPAPVPGPVVSKPSTWEYPNIMKPTSPQSPKQKILTSPPSPLSLPPSQLNPVPEPESKTVLMTEHKNVKVNERERNKTEKPRTNTSSTNNATHNNQNGAASGIGAHHKKTSEDEEQGVRVITIAGENKGAYMELGSSKKKANLLPHQLHKKPKDSEKQESSDEATSKKDGKAISITGTTRHMKAYVNSNVQGINNSILLNSCCAHTDPGVHLLFSKNKPTVNKN